MIAYRIKVDSFDVSITEFSYEKTTALNYTGAKMQRTIHGSGYIPRDGRVAKQDARDSAPEAIDYAVERSRHYMEERKREVNRISRRIGQLESLRGKLSAA